MPPNGFDDLVQPRGCAIPFMLQTSRQPCQYSCVAWVENSLLVLRYVYGVYNLYAITPADRADEPRAQPKRAEPMPAIMALQAR